jgi:hypothetical protein
MSQLAGAARRWYKHRYQLKRTAGFYDSGQYVRLPPTTSFHSGNFMAPSQKQIERLPVGSRADGAQTLYTDVALRTAESPNQLADRVLFNGTEYEVSSGEQWASHNWYIVTKVGQ